MKVEIKVRMLTAGNRSLYLEYYETGFRKRENLHLYLVPDDAPNARKLNEQTYRKAQEIQAQRILTPPSFEKKQKTEENEAAKTMTWLQWCGDYVRCAMLDGNCPKMIQHKDVVRRRIETYLKRAKKTDVLLKDVDRDLVSGLFGYMRNYRNRKQIKANGGRLAAYTLVLFEETVKAIFNKATSPAILSTYGEVLNAVADTMITNMPYEDISSLVKMQLSDMSGWNITSYSVTGYGGTEECYSMPGQALWVMWPDYDTVNVAKDLIAQVMAGQTPVIPED